MSYVTAVSRPVERALALSIVEGSLAALMMGVTECYLGACALALGHGDAALAVLCTLPLFAGSLAQACTGPLVLWLGSRKRLVVLAACVQALSQVGLFCVAYADVHALWPLLSLSLLYFVSGMVMVPAWGAWMGALTEHVDRQRYFAIRSAGTSIVLLAAFIGGGYHLHAAERSHSVSRAYALLFAVGFVARTLSALMLQRQLEPPAPPRDSWLRVLARTRAALRGEGFRLALGFSLLMFGTFISAPFYPPYMLKTLALGYGGYAFICAVQLGVKSLAFPIAHRVALRMGVERVLLISAALMCSVAWLWGSCTNLGGLLLAQTISGVAWAGYEFASFQLLLRSARPSHRVEFLAVAASLTGFMQLAGALFGSWLITHAGMSYRQVFLVSAVARALPLLVLVPLLYGKRLEAARSFAAAD